MWISLDGFIAGPDGDMNWVTGIFDDTMGKYENDLLKNVDTILLGRVTYESFADAWPKVPNDVNISAAEREYALKINSMKKVVVSKSLKNTAWSNSEIMNELDVKNIENLKIKNNKNILIYGSASIVQSLTNLGLVDEYQFLVHPVILGDGKLLFENIEKPINLRLTKSDVFPSGVVLLHYEPINHDL